MNAKGPASTRRYLARVVIEFETAFIIGGGNDLFFDDTFVADANGLPAIPGSTLAGILRHAWKDAGYGNGDDLFGHQELGSPLEVSWGCIHDRNSTPVEGVVHDQKLILADPVLREALTMAARDHVRIGHRGTSETQGKFDERSVSAGHRFTFELQLTDKGKDKQTEEKEEKNEAEERWRRLLSMLLSDQLRIGGKSRRGYGAFCVVSLSQRSFDLAKDNDFCDYVAHPVSLAEPTPMPEMIAAGTKVSAAAPLPKSCAATLTLKPQGFWMFGGGFGEHADMNPQRANRIEWDNCCKGRVVEHVALVPGSSVKGALAHRTAYYHNLLSGRFAENAEHPDENRLPRTGDDNEAVKALFGFNKGKKSGQRGRVIISDIFADAPGTPKVVNHVSIDRFTGGARSGLLFSEEPFYGGPGFSLKITVVERDQIDKTSWSAFEWALKDLASGLLPLGGGVNRGNGFFEMEGDITWNVAQSEQKEAANG